MAWRRFSQRSYSGFGNADTAALKHADVCVSPVDTTWPCGQSPGLARLLPSASAEKTKREEWSFPQQLREPRPVGSGPFWSGPFRSGPALFLVSHPQRDARVRREPPSGALAGIMSSSPILLSSRSCQATMRQPRRPAAALLGLFSRLLVQKPAELLGHHPSFATLRACRPTRHCCRSTCAESGVAAEQVILQSELAMHLSRLTYTRSLCPAGSGHDSSRALRSTAEPHTLGDAAPVSSFTMGSWE